MELIDIQNILMSGTVIYFWCFLGSWCLLSFISGLTGAFTDKHDFFNALLWPITFFNILGLAVNALYERFTNA